MSEDDDIVLGRPGHEPGDAGTPLWYENQRKAMEEMNAGLADQLRAKRATPMSEAQPETVAGRQLDAEFGVGQFGRVTRLVLKAEAEARAAGAARYEAALTSLLGEVGFMRSCVASGERLDKADLDRQDKAMAQAVALLAAAPLPEPLPQGDGLDVRIEKLRNALLFITAHDGAFRASDAAESWRVASAALIADNKATPSRPAEERKP